MSQTPEQKEFTDWRRDAEARAAYESLPLAQRGKRTGAPKQHSNQIRERDPRDRD